MQPYPTQIGRFLSGFARLSLFVQSTSRAGAWPRSHDGPGPTVDVRFLGTHPLPVRRPRRPLDPRVSSSNNH